MSGPFSDQPAQGSIDLAAAPPFWLGPLEVRPPTREVRAEGAGLHVVEPRVMQVLVALSQAKGAVVSRDSLVARCWDGRIVGDDAINRAIAKARQIADFASPAAFAIESVPRVGYRLIEAGRREQIEASAAPVAAPGPARAPAETVTAPPRRRAVLAAGLAGGGLLVLGGALGYRAYHGRSRPDPLIAVLPFDNLSSDRELGYFADGLSEDILNALGHGGDLRVMARSSSFTLRGAAKAQAAQALGADYLLDGSVLRDGQRLRVNAHLSDAQRREVIWSDTFDRDLTQSLQLEDEIAQQVAGALRLKLASRTQQLIDPEIYELYLKGRAAMRSPARDILEDGDRMLREVIRRAPRFAPAWLELAKTAWRDAYLYPEDVQDERFAFGKKAAEQVIALDPSNGPAVSLKGQMSRWFNNWAEWEDGQTRGLKLTPNDPELLTWRGWFCLNTGRLDLAVQFLVRAQTLDPLYFWTNSILLDALIHADQRAAAEATWTRNRALWPQSGPYDRYWVLAGSGREREAAVWLSDHLSQAGPWGPAYVQAMQALSASEADRAAAVATVLRTSGLGMGLASEGMKLLARLGAGDQAVSLANSVYLNPRPFAQNHAMNYPGVPSYPQHGQAFSYHLFHPFLAPLRKAGRLTPVFDGIGLTPFWRQVGGPAV